MTSLWLLAVCSVTRGAIIVGDVMLPHGRAGSVPKSNDAEPDEGALISGCCCSLQLHVGVFNCANMLQWFLECTRSFLRLDAGRVNEFLILLPCRADFRKDDSFYEEGTAVRNSLSYGRFVRTKESSMRQSLL